MPSFAALRNPLVARLLIGFGLSTAAGVFLGLIGPFGMYLNDDLAIRMAYCVGTFWIASLIYCSVLTVGQRWADQMRWPVRLWLPVAVLLAAIPVAAVSRVAALALWPWISPHVGLIEWYGQSLTISVVAVVLATLFFRALDRSRPAPVQSAALTGRLPPRLGADVLCLQMEDHYVRVHTPTGSDLVLMPMGQAIAAMAPREGLQVHRSWWVARSAVEGVIEDGRNLRLRLRGGLEAPVSRPNVARLREAGWLDA